MKKNKLEHIKKTGFKTPEAYFDTLEDAVFSKMASKEFPKRTGFKNPDKYFDSVEENVLKKLPLDDKKKTTGYKIPENYLKTIEENVFKTINSEQKEPKVINFKTVFLKRLIPLAAAASLLLFVFIGYNNNNDNDLDQLASTDIEEWINNDLIAFETYEITEVFEDIELESQPLFEDEEIIDYLNGTDIENLIQEN